jgi:GNAT superfamily N-acetyltransferase
MSGKYFLQKNLNIVVLTNKDVNFYNLLGRYLSRKDIFKELSSNVWDEDGKIWFVVFENKTIVGFAGIIKNKFILLDPIYILPNYRKQGLGSELMKYIIGYCKNVDCLYIQSICTQLGEKLHNKCGFVKVSNKGQYSVMRYNLK